MSHIEERFGEFARRDFVIPTVGRKPYGLATLPRIGTIKHGYETPSAGFALARWIFFDYDDYEMNFIHILHNRTRQNRHPILTSAAVNAPRDIFSTVPSSRARRPGALSLRGRGR